MTAEQGDFFTEPPGHEATRSLLDSLLSQSRRYHASADYKALLDFIVRLRNFAPFNAMLLELQKPGLGYAASESDWWTRFGRKPKYKARPLLILLPFGPVGLVYDVMDTEGLNLPSDVSFFPAQGPILETDIQRYQQKIEKREIQWIDFDAGDRSAGEIKQLVPPLGGGPGLYQIAVNKNHKPPTRFATIAHELAHLFLGHLGPDKALGVPARRSLTHAQRELEAESVAYIVCSRKGVATKSEVYLENFVKERTTVDDLDVYQVTRAAGQIESLLGIAPRSLFERPRAQGQT
ncbi:ImmA/IrrE family metallo-endopeptidase [Bradyrhizobium liaoningense]|uniref:ImmA/IrrE family metallo-endopeptidase n=1 Tax=Bradyrhizobium liaoningense TaxID=43992 RepID=UPI001BA53450|nr:ImmA/IrrE family metallo-endopeptidase [Bradyrhizobium liaoningense]MBR1032963.1 ImmA/IrrE family metallo-endopeptidase [Bradyrhizobium liaoningense]